MQRSYLQDCCSHPKLFLILQPASQGDFCCGCRCGQQYQGLWLRQVQISLWRLLRLLFIAKMESSCLPLLFLFLLLLTCRVSTRGCDDVANAAVYRNGAGSVCFVFQNISISFTSGANKGRKRVSVGHFHPRVVAFMNLAQDFVNKLLLYSDFIEGFC